MILKQSPRTSQHTSLNALSQTDHSVMYSPQLQGVLIYQAIASVALEGFTISPALHADFLRYQHHQLSLNTLIQQTQHRALNQDDGTATKTHSNTHHHPSSLPYEGDLTCLRIFELKLHPVIGNFDAVHLKEINRRILQDLPMYRGGELRSDRHTHVRSRQLATEQDAYIVHYKQGEVSDEVINFALQKIGDISDLSALSHQDFAERLAVLYGDLDHIHAFNEANSRTLRIFTEQLAKVAGQLLDWSRIYMLTDARDVVYRARDLAVSQRSYPALSVETMRTASSSVFDAYNTQQKLKDAKALRDLLLEDLMLPYAQGDDPTDTWMKSAMDGCRRMSLDEGFRQWLALNNRLTMEKPS